MPSLTFDPCLYVNRMWGYLISRSSRWWCVNPGKWTIQMCHEVNFLCEHKIRVKWVFESEDFDFDVGFRTFKGSLKLLSSCPWFHSQIRWEEHSFKNINFVFFSNCQPVTLGVDPRWAKHSLAPLYYLAFNLSFVRNKDGYLLKWLMFRFG